MHGVAKSEIKRQIVGARIGFVCGKKEKRFVRPFVELELGHSRTQALHVARKGIFQEVLARAVKPLLLCEICSSMSVSQAIL